MATSVRYPQAPGLNSSAAAGTYKPNHRSARLNFWDDPGDGSVPSPLYVGVEKVELDRPLVSREVHVSDVRGTEDQYTLDGQAFEFRRHTTSCNEIFGSDDKIKTDYYVECEQLLMDATRAPRAYVFDHRVRRSTGEGKTGPVSRAHVDESEAGAEAYLRHYLPNEADELAKRRWQIVNVWRPIRTIQRDPLTVADGTSFSGRDFVGAVVHYDTWDGESLAVMHSPAQRWFYKHQMKPDEVVLIKNFDSDRNVPARMCPHSAIEDSKDLEVEARQSIEVRAFVFY